MMEGGGGRVGEGVTVEAGVEAGVRVRVGLEDAVSGSGLEGGARSQARREPLEAAEGKGVDSPPETPEGTESC